MRSEGTTGTATTYIPGVRLRIYGSAVLCVSGHEGPVCWIQGELGFLGLWGGTKGKDRVGLSQST